MKLSELAATQWSGKDVTIATAVALAESRGKMDAQHKNSNGTWDDGPWQVNSVHGYDRARLKSDPAYTVAAAHDVWKSEGWKAWTTYKTQAYVPFLGSDAELNTGDVKSGNIGGNALDDAVGAAGDALNSVPGVSEVSGGVDAIAKTVSTLSNPSTWLRLGKGALGGVLVIFGVGSVVFVVANKAASTPVVKAATKAIP